MERRDLGDTAVGRFMTLVFDLIFINLLFIICSLPVFTSGAAAAAMYSVMLKLERGDLFNTFEQFFKSFKSSFRSAVPVCLLVLLGVAIFGGDIWFAINQKGTVKTVYFVVAAIVGASAFSIAAWAYPLIAVYNNTTKEYLKNSLILAGGMPLYTITVWVIWAIPFGLLLLMNMDIIKAIGYFYVLMGFTIPCYLSCKIIRRGLAKADPEYAKKFEAEGEKENEPQ